MGLYLYCLVNEAYRVVLICGLSFIFKDFRFLQADSLRNLIHFPFSPSPYPTRLYMSETYIMFKKLQIAVTLLNVLVLSAALLVNPVKYWQYLWLILHRFILSDTMHVSFLIIWPLFACLCYLTAHVSQFLRNDALKHFLINRLLHVVWLNYSSNLSLHGIINERLKYII